MLVLINKPKSMTSHDVVNKIRFITKEKRVGHAGTLDPNATGLLIIAIGRESTKKLGEITKFTQKEYIADIFLGEERDTDDVEGNIVSRNEQITPTISQIKKVLLRFKGDIEQIPPAYSAIKLNGKKSYDLARSGKKVDLKPRRVLIYQNQLISYKYPILKIRFLVSSGTYIRSLARDIGRDLKTFAYLKDLKRTKIGNYKIEDSQTLEQFTAAQADAPTKSWEER